MSGPKSDGGRGGGAVNPCCLTLVDTSVTASTGCGTSLWQVRVALAGQAVPTVVAACAGLAKRL